MPLCSGWAGWTGWAFVHQEFGSSLNPGAPVAMWTCPLQVLAATLILSQPGGGVRLYPPYAGVHTKF